MKAAYSNDLKEKRNIYMVLAFVTIIILAVTHWESIRGRESAEEAIKNATAKRLGWWFLLATIVNAFVIENEEKWKTKQIEAMQRELARLQDEIARHKAFIKHEELMPRYIIPLSVFTTP